MEDLQKNSLSTATDQHRISLINIYMMVAVSYILVFLPLYFFYYHTYFLGWLLLADLITFIYCFYHVYRTKTVDLATVAICYVAVITIVTVSIDGGAANGGPFFVFPATVFLFFLRDSKRGLQWSLALCIPLIVALGLHKLNLLNLPYPSDEWLFFILADIFLITLLYSYSKQKEKLDLKLQASLIEIEKLAKTLDLEKKNVEQKIVERTEELREALLSTQNERDKVSAIVQSIGDGVFVLDKDRNIISANTVTLQLSGYEKRELIGAKYTDVLRFISEKNGEASTEFIDKVYDEGAISAMANHTALIRKDGEHIPVSDSAAPLRDLTGAITGCVVVFRDVTKEREVDRMKDDFLSMAAHQLRTPLTALRWQAQRLMRQKIGPLNPGQVELAEDINFSTIRLIDLVGQLLDVSHIETGTLLLRPSPTDVQPIIEELLKLVALRFSDKHQEITFEKPDNFPTLSADSHLIAQVYQNLLVNACKYTPAEGKITISLAIEGNMAITKVRDTGIGILDKDSETLFGRFSRGSSEEVNQEEGTGLGLYLAKKIVEASGGEIGFTSETTGTTFWFSLPIAPTS